MAVSNNARLFSRARLSTQTSAFAAPKISTSPQISSATKLMTTTLCSAAGCSDALARIPGPVASKSVAFSLKSSVPTNPPSAKSALPSAAVLVRKTETINFSGYHFILQLMQPIDAHTLLSGTKCLIPTAYCRPPPLGFRSRCLSMADFSIPTFPLHSRVVAYPLIRRYIWGRLRSGFT